MEIDLTFREGCLEPRLHLCVILLVELVEFFRVGELHVESDASRAG